MLLNNYKNEVNGKLTDPLIQSYMQRHPKLFLSSCTSRLSHIVTLDYDYFTDGIFSKDENDNIFSNLNAGINNNNSYSINCNFSSCNKYFIVGAGKSESNDFNNQHKGNSYRRRHNQLRQRLIGLISCSRPTISRIKKNILWEAKKSSNNVSLSNPLTLEKIKYLMCHLIEPENLKVEGIFRKTGKLTDQNQIVKFILNDDNNYNKKVTASSYEMTTLFRDFFLNFSAIACASALKKVLTMLEVPLLPLKICLLFNQFNGIKLVDRKLELCQILFLLLPENHRDLLYLLFKLLKKFAKYEKYNKMSIKSLSIMFVPSIFGMNPVGCASHLKNDVEWMKSQNIEDYVTLLSYFISTYPTNFKVSQVLKNELLSHPDVPKDIISLTDYGDVMSTNCYRPHPLYAEKKLTLVQQSSIESAITRNMEYWFRLPANYYYNDKFLQYPRQNHYSSCTKRKSISSNYLCTSGASRKISNCKRLGTSSNKIKKINENTPKIEHISLINNHDDCRSIISDSSGASSCISLPSLSMRSSSNSPQLL